MHAPRLRPVHRRSQYRRPCEHARCRCRTHRARVRLTKLTKLKQRHSLTSRAQWRGIRQTSTIERENTVTDLTTEIIDFNKVWKLDTTKHQGAVRRPIVCVRQISGVTSTEQQDPIRSIHSEDLSHKQIQSHELSLHRQLSRTHRCTKRPPSQRKARHQRPRTLRLREKHAHPSAPRARKRL